jgi:hypothetical protein
MTSPKSICVSFATVAVLSLSSASAYAAGALVGAPVRSSYIYVTHRANPDVAANLAMSRCLDQYGSGCHVIKIYFNGCLAIAQSSDGSHHSGWAVKPSMQEANLLAIGQCAKYGSSCHLDVSNCE